MIIGLTGTAGSGKGTVAKILEEKGYSYYSCSDYLRGQLREKGIEITIPNLANLGNKIREKYGFGEIAKRLLKEIKEDKAIVDSIRHPGEIEALKESGRLVLIAVDVPMKIRYERIQGRKKQEDRMSFEEFEEEERKQMAVSGPEMQLANCISMADYKIINDGSLEELKEKVLEILAKLG